MTTTTTPSSCKAFRSGHQGSGPKFVRPDPVAIDEFRWDHLPFGMWVAEDGREILFNRDGCPLWDRRDGGAPIPADKRECVPVPLRPGTHGIFYFFYSDRTPDKARCGLEALKSWGIDPTVPPSGLISVCRDQDIDINKLRARDVAVLRERLWQLEIDALRAAMGCTPTMQSTL